MSGLQGEGIPSATMIGTVCLTQSSPWRRATRTCTTRRRVRVRRSKGREASGPSPWDVVGRARRELGLPPETIAPLRRARERVDASNSPSRGASTFPCVDGGRSFSHVLLSVREDAVDVYIGSIPAPVLPAPPVWAPQVCVIGEGGRRSHILLSSIR